MSFFKYSFNIFPKFNFQRSNLAGLRINYIHAFLISYVSNNHTKGLTSTELAAVIWEEDKYSIFSHFIAFKRKRDTRMQLIKVSVFQSRLKEKVMKTPLLATDNKLSLRYEHTHTYSGKVKVSLKLLIEYHSRIFIN